MPTVAEEGLMRIVVVANKYWEADPLVGVLTSDGDREYLAVPKPVEPRARPRGFGALEIHPVTRPAPQRDVPATPRLRFMLAGAAVEVWCLQDLMDPMQSSSSSAEKHHVVGRALEGRAKPSLVVAVGTAASPGGAVQPGSVLIGDRFLVHDADSNNPASPLRLAPELVDVILDPPAGEPDLIRGMPPTLSQEASRRFVRPPVGGESVVRCGTELVSVGTLNVTDYSKYKTADPESLSSFETAAQRAGDPSLVPASVETTHGLIGLAARDAGAPFVWVSGIANPVGAYDEIVRPREYAQNFAAAHNAGVAVAWVLPEFVRRLVARA